jgi:hypothetical protein
MSDYNVAAELGRAVNDLTTHHMSLPPRMQNVHRAAMGAGILTFCVYWAWHAQAFIHISGWTLLLRFFNPPAHASSVLWWAVLIWAGMILVGCFWLVIGITNSRGPRDTMKIFWALARVAIPTALILYGAYPSDWPDAKMFLCSLYYAHLASFSLEAVLLMLGPPHRSLQSNAHGQARVATADDLRRSGIVR